MARLGEQTRDALKKVSTATLTSILFKRGLRNQFIQDVHPLNRSAGTMVGEAFTLRYIPAREDLNPMTVFRDPAHPQRKARPRPRTSRSTRRSTSTCRSAAAMRRYFPAM
jgi:hypothetical protein